MQREFLGFLISGESNFTCKLAQQVPQHLKKTNTKAFTPPSETATRHLT